MAYYREDRVTGMLDRAAIVAAHPDDEVLWFSSVLDRVGTVICCFLTIRSNAVITAGRKRVLLEYPLETLSCLDLREAETLHGVDWRNPKLTEFGVEIDNKAFPHREYEDNYRRLRDLLEPKLAGCRNVITHSPWGEYGNDEHIQVYRVVSGLRKELGYTVWFPNYCSNISLPLAMPYLSGYDVEHVSLRTNEALHEEVKRLYLRHNCWTWFHDWRCFREESFVRDADLPRPLEYGHGFPMNVMRITFPERRRPAARRNSLVRMAAAFFSLHAR